MNATTRYSQVLLAPWRQRDPAAPWGRRLIAALVVAIGAASLIWLPAGAGWRVAVGLLLVIGMGAWMAVAGNLLEQNHPTAARTVPGHLRTLKRAALLGWALFTGLSAALIMLMVPLKEFWPIVLLNCGLLTAFLLWTTRMVWLWMLLILVSPLSLAFAGRLAPVKQAVMNVWQSHPYEVLLLSLVFQAWLVTRAFSAGGLQHQARYAQQALMRNAMQLVAEGRSPGVSSWAPFERLLRPFVRILSAWLQHLLDRADNSNPRSVMARAEIVLNGTQHWLRYALTMGSIAAAVMVLFTIVVSSTDASLAFVLQHGGFGMGIGIASAGLNPGFTLPNMLWSSRREQALLRLLPGMPQGQALNLAVARLHWRDFAVSWMVTTLLLLALGTAIGNQLLLCLPLASLPVAALMLTRRPALMRTPTPTIAMVPSFGFLLLAGILYVLTRDAGVPLEAHAVVMLAVSVPLLAWRWRRLVTAPTALPAGRLAA